LPSCRRDVEEPEQAARLLANWLLDAIDQPIVLGGQQASRLSIGIALAPKDGSDIDELLKWADIALIERRRTKRIPIFDAEAIHRRRMSGRNCQGARAIDR
jgi:GGDEF domain-containing protein